MAQDYPGSRSLILQALRSGGVPDNSLEICLASITRTTIQQYNVGLKLWWQFRKSKNLDLFVASVPEILQFFTLHFQNGASFGSLSSYRAALAQILEPSVTSDFRIRRFFKGVHSLRPSLPKYNHTWDPSIVLSYVREMSKTTLTLEDLTYKLAILIALATGQRVQTLANINIDNIVNYGTKIVIKIPNRIKTSGKGKLQPTLVLPFYDLDKNICPSRTLLAYLEKTKDLRGTSSNLFITFKKPFRNATAQTIGRWLKTMLKRSGLDTDQFSAHSTRHASTSAAARRGVSYDTIRIAAGWTQKSSTFALFYNRPIIEDNVFGTTILGC